MHPNQIETSPELVRALLQSQMPQLATLPIAPRPFSGTDNAVYRVGDHYSVRLPIVDWAVSNEEHMKPWLPWLRERLDTDVPVPIYYGEPDLGYPHMWAIYPWLAGNVLEMGCNDPHVAREIAAFLNQVRSLPTDGAPAAGRSPHALDPDVRAALANFLPEEQPDELIAIWDQLMTTPAWNGEDSLWMHGDVAPGNLIFEEGCLVAAIDWSGLGVGDPASDLQVAWNMLASEARAVFREAMAVDDATWDRARARAFTQACFQLPYYRETNRPLAAQARYVFEQILDEVS